MATNTAMPSGYVYEFVQEIPEDYICIICQLAMRNPVQTASCGHQYCKECLGEAYKRNPNICPFDQGNLTPQDIFPNKFVERKILSLEIKCPHQGCDWQGELRDIENHENRCEHKVVQCDNQSCNVKKARREMVVHVQEECQYRMVPCPHCNNTTLFCLLEVHKSKCLKYPVSCPNGCVKTVKREEVAGHLSDECPLTIVPCGYHNIGCGVKVQRKDLDDHIEHQNKQHLDIAIGKIASLQEQVDDICTRFQRQVDEMKNQMSAMPCMGTVEHIQTQIDAIINKQIPPTIQDIVKVIPPNAPIMTKDDEGHYNYVWKITDFIRTLQAIRKKPGTFINGEPFYTHKCGYKLQFLLHGGDKKTVIVQLKVIQSDYDDKLTWPPPWNTINVILLDQKPNPLQLNHIEYAAFVNKGMGLNKRPLKYQSILRS